MRLLRGGVSGGRRRVCRIPCSGSCMEQGRKLEQEFGGGRAHIARGMLQPLVLWQAGLREEDRVL